MNQAQYDLMFRLMVEGSTSLYLKGEKQMMSAPGLVCISLMEALNPCEKPKLISAIDAAKDAALSQYRSEVDL
jgi:hypothetical protein